VAGTSIASVLQFMSGEKVLRVLQSERFRAAFTEYCPDIPVDSISFLISLNLGVAKSLSGLDAVGPVVDWIEQEKRAQVNKAPFTLRAAWVRLAPIIL